MRLLSGIVRAQLEPIALRYRKRELERIDRIEAKIAAEERSVRIDRFGLDPVDVQALHDELGELVLGRRLRRRRVYPSSRRPALPLRGGKKAAQCIIRAAAHPAATSRESVSNLFASERHVLNAMRRLPPLRIGYARERGRAPRASPTCWPRSVSAASAEAHRRSALLRVGLDAVGESAVEVWRGDGTIQHGRDGALRWSSDGDYGFFAIEVDEPGGATSRPRPRRAYRELTACIRASATPHVLRLWNYFDAINRRRRRR